MVVDFGARQALCSSGSDVCAVMSNRPVGAQPLRKPVACISAPVCSYADCNEHGRTSEGNHGRSDSPGS